MLKFINISNFMSYLFDDESQALKAAEIVRAILEAQWPRLSNVAEKMDGKAEANYKAIQRFISRVDVKRQLQRLFQEEAQFVIGDPTEMPRYEAPKTAYVGTLSDEKTPGYWLLVLSTPFFRGRAIPFISSPIHRRPLVRKRLLATRNTSVHLSKSKRSWETNLWCSTGNSVI